MTSRFLALLIAISGLVFSGCGTSEIDPVTNDVSQQMASAQTGGLISAAAAETFTENLFIPVDIAVFIPCANNGAGEDVVLSGFLHDLFHITINGDRIVVKIHDQPQGITGVGSITGDKYQGTGVTQETFSSAFSGFPFTDTFVNSFKIIGQGKGNNYLVQEILHITVNADGTVTAFVDNLSVECK